MMQDALTVAWKEFRELLNRRGSTKVTFASAAVILLVFGVLQPSQIGDEWFTSIVGPLLLGMVPLILIITTIADSIAGERERKTLETLLATRLSDANILGGKLLASLGWAWGMQLVAALLGAVTVNVVRARQGLGLSFYDPTVLAVALGGGLLLGGFMAGLGILISLRASSVRTAQQIMGFVLAGAVGGGSILFSVGPKQWRADLARYVATHTVATLALTVGGILLAIDLALLAACRARFRRAKLILD